MMFIVILAVSIIVRNALLSRRKRRLLPLLTKEASGPYFSTKVDKDGIILPDVSYRHDSLGQEEGKHLRTEEGSDKKRKLFLLNPAELLNIAIIQENNVGEGGEDKKIIDDAQDKLSARVDKDRGQDDLSAQTVVTRVETVLPLTAPYQAGRLVSQVWQGRHQLHQLYRYSQIDRLVLPPGYVNQNTWA